MKKTAARATQRKKRKWKASREAVIFLAIISILLKGEGSWKKGIAEGGKEGRKKCRNGRSFSCCAALT